MADKKRGIKAYERLAYGKSTVSRGTCKKCGGLGHLTFECKNNLTLTTTSIKPRHDPFAEEKARLRADIEQLLREKKERQQKKNKTKLTTHEPGSDEEDRERRPKHRRHSRRRSRSPEESGNTSDSSSVSDSSSASRDSK
ncbi:hypothetical protein IWW42_000650 [Coemansia sp. RSA 1085]|nr:hypothetical protein IWW42_000650 [Coemansia sp. RSA 1085]